MRCAKKRCYLTHTCTHEFEIGFAKVCERNLCFHVRKLQSSQSDTFTFPTSISFFFHACHEEESNEGPRSDILDKEEEDEEEEDGRAPSIFNNSLFLLLLGHGGGAAPY